MEMTRINVLTNNDFISFYFFYPLLANKNRLGEMGISLKFYERLKEDIYACDILMLDSKYFRPLWENRASALALIQKIRDKSKTLYWLDTTDSTGATHFQVLPYVDKYWKKQLLKDRALYEEDFYGARIYTDYYKKNFSLGNEDVFSVEPLKKEHASKLSVSWNLGAGPIMANVRAANLIRLLPWSVKKFLKFRYRYRAHPPEKLRTRAISFRGSSNYINKALSFQRLLTIEKLKDLGVETGPVKKDKYIKEMKDSKIGVSPFGGGEICFRDFEIILCGALLYKPSMDHLQTYPDIFIDNETYVSFRWDFSDFGKQIEDLLQDPERVTGISVKAQKKYEHFFSEEGREEFCRRFFTNVTAAN